MIFCLFIPCIGTVDLTNGSSQRFNLGSGEIKPFVIHASIFQINFTTDIGMNS
jgi:hypothetical protein